MSEQQRVHAASSQRNQSTQGNTVVLNPPTQEQEDYLRQIERSSSDYDRNAVVGGPRQFRA